MSERLSIAPQRRPATITPIDPSAIAPPEHHEDLYLEANGRSAPFAEHTPPAFAPPTAYFPPAQNIRPAQLTSPNDWRGEDWRGGNSALGYYLCVISH